MKKCSMCGQEKSLDEYAKNRTRPDGLQGHCKACQKAYQAKYLDKKFGEARAKAKARKAERQAEQERALAVKVAAVQVPEGFKRCSKCKEVRPVTDFSKNSVRSDGLQCQCKHCHAELRQRLLERRIAEHAAKGEEATPSEKRCTTCKELKPISEFYPNIRTVDGVQARCKRCSLDANKSHAQAKNTARAAKTAARRAAMLEAQEKRCRRCGEVKPFSEFWKSKSGLFGRNSQCKACWSAMRKRQWRERRLGRGDLSWEERRALRTAKAAARIAAQEKECTRCKQVRPLSEFYRDKRRPDGLYSHCKVCHYATRKAYDQSERGRRVIRESRRRARAKERSSE